MATVFNKPFTYATPYLTGILFAFLKESNMVEQVANGPTSGYLLKYCWLNLGLVVMSAVFVRWLDISNPSLDALSYTLIVTCSSMVVLDCCIKYEQGKEIGLISKIVRACTDHPLVVYLVHPIIVTIFYTQYNDLMYEYENNLSIFGLLYLVLLLLYYYITFSIASLLTEFILKPLFYMSRKISMFV